jgi:hypothetical protein
MKINTILVLLGVFAVWATPSKAAVSFQLQYVIGQIPGLANGVSKALLVIDTAGDGFSGISDVDTNNTTRAALANFSLTSGTSLGDDLVLAVFTAEDIGGVSGFQTPLQNPQTFTTSSSFAGKQFGLYYFQAGSNALGNTFGFFRSDTPDGDLGGTYVVPGDGNLLSLLSVTTNAGGSGVPFSGTPSVAGSIGTVPEPSRVMLAAMGLGAFVLRRRRQA